MNFKFKYNALREAGAMNKMNKAKRKKYKAIIDGMGECQITLEDISKGQKLDGLAALLDEHGATLDEYVILGQYSNAIYDKNTKSAEFLRDTAGEKPSTQVDLNSKTETGIGSMSLEELIELRDLLKNKKEGK